MLSVQGSCRSRGWQSICAVGSAAALPHAVLLCLQCSGVAQETLVQKSRLCSEFDKLAQNPGVLLGGGEILEKDWGVFIFVCA